METNNRRLWIALVLGALLYGLVAVAGRFFFPPPPPAPKETKPVEQVKVEEKKEPVKDPVVQNKEEQAAVAALPVEQDYVLDSPNSKISAVLSGRGAAVRSVTLKHHFKATWDHGLQELDAAGKPIVLKLIDDNYDGNWAKLPGGVKDQLERLSYRFMIVPNAGAQLPANLAFLKWKAVDVKPSQVSFQAEIPEKNLKVTQQFSLPDDAYHLNMKYLFEPLDAAKPTEAITYAVDGPRSFTLDGTQWRYATPFRQVITGLTDSKKPSAAYRYLATATEINVPAGKPPIKPWIVNDPKINSVFLYAGVTLQQFCSALVVDAEAGQLPPSIMDRVEQIFFGNDEQGRAGMIGKITARTVSAPVTVPAGKSVTHPFLLYTGPSKILLLSYEKQKVNEALIEKYTSTHHLNLVTDAPWYNWTGYTGLSGLIVFMTNLMHRLLEWIYAIVRNYGVAIIIMTFIVRLCMMPLSLRQAAMTKKTAEQMKKMKPEMDEIKKKYGSDRQAYAAAQMELYRKHKFNMFGSCGGCLIAFVQMPIFMGLFYALGESTNLRLSKFLWIDNLSMPDMLWNWANIPGLGWLANVLNLGPYLNILPLISAFLMYLYQKAVMPPPADEQQEMQQKVMNYMMIFMAYMFYWIASGLCIYFIVSSAWGMLEKKFTKKPPTDDNDDKTNGKPDKPKGKSKAEMKAQIEKDSLSLSQKVAEFWRDLQAKADKRN